MKNSILALRSLFKRGQNNNIKILSLGVGLAMGLVLIAKIYFYVHNNISVFNLQPSNLQYDK